jgi:hypothetical protein
MTPHRIHKLFRAYLVITNITHGDDRLSGGRQILCWNVGFGTGTEGTPKPPRLPVPPKFQHPQIIRVLLSDTKQLGDARGLWAGPSPHNAVQKTQKACYSILHSTVERYHTILFFGTPLSFFFLHCSHDCEHLVSITHAWWWGRCVSCHHSGPTLQYTIGGGGEYECSLKWKLGGGR